MLHVSQRICHLSCLNQLYTFLISQSDTHTSQKRIFFLLYRGLKAVIAKSVHLLDKLHHQGIQND